MCCNEHLQKKLFKSNVQIAQLFPFASELLLHDKAAAGAACVRVRDYQRQNF